MPNVRHATLLPEEMAELLERCAAEGMQPDQMNNIIPYYKVCRRSRVDAAELEATQPWITTLLQAEANADRSRNHYLGATTV